MTYREPLSDQVLIFISAVGPGVLIGFLYDVIFSFFRSFGKKRPVIITADLCFSLLATLLSFFYMVVYNNGTVRLNIIIAQVMGAVAFHFTLGKYIEKPVVFVSKLLADVISFAIYPVVFFLNKTVRILSEIKKKTESRIKLKEKLKLRRKK